MVVTVTPADFMWAYTAVNNSGLPYRMGKLYIVEKSLQVKHTKITSFLEDRIICHPIMLMYIRTNRENFVILVAKIGAIPVDITKYM